MNRDLKKSEDLNGKLLQEISDKNNKIAELEGQNARLHNQVLHLKDTVTQNDANYFPTRKES